MAATAVTANRKATHGWPVMSATIVTRVASPSVKSCQGRAPTAATATRMYSTVMMTIEATIARGRSRSGVPRLLAGRGRRVEADVREEQAGGGGRDPGGPHRGEGLEVAGAEGRERDGDEEDEQADLDDDQDGVDPGALAGPRARARAWRAGRARRRGGSAGLPRRAGRRRRRAARGRRRAAPRRRTGRRPPRRPRPTRRTRARGTSRRPRRCPRRGSRRRSCSSSPETGTLPAISAYDRAESRAATPARTNASKTAGPARGTAVPSTTRMPVPSVAPMLMAVRCQTPEGAPEAPASDASASRAKASRGLRRSSCSPSGAGEAGEEGAARAPQRYRREGQPAPASGPAPARQVVLGSAGQSSSTCSPSWRTRAIASRRDVACSFR